MGPGRYALAILVGLCSADVRVDPGHPRQQRGRLDAAVREREVRMRLSEVVAALTLGQHPVDILDCGPAEPRAA
jgi:hypothetical protein